MDQETIPRRERKYLVTDGDCSVHLIMGSAHDIKIVEKAIEVLEEFEVPYSVTVASAHRTPDIVESVVKSSSAKVFLAFAGLSAALPGVIASHTLRPVIGVPVSGAINLDAILSIIQMPPGVPVGGVGLDRGENAALLGVRILAITDRRLEKALVNYVQRMRDKVFSSHREVLGE